MKTVLLLGDSIRVGYDKSVQAALSGKANVCFPEENCRFAAYLLRNLHEYRTLLPEGKADVIHWNAGLWDCLHLFEEEAQTPIDVYAYYIDRICKRIQKLFPEAEVIFATSTSVISEKMGKDFKRYNEEIEAYNAAAVEVVKRYGFVVNDLYAFSRNLPPEARTGPTHFNSEVGTALMAEAVLACLRPYLALEGDVGGEVVIHTDETEGF